MKKFAIAMFIMILVGAIIIGIGCAVYFGSGKRIQSKDAEYVEKTFNATATPNEFEFELAGAHDVILQRGEKTTLKYSDSNISQFTVTEADGKLKAVEKETLKFWERLIYKEKRTEVVLTLPENAKVALKGDISGAVNINLPSWEYGAIDLSVSGAGNISGSELLTGDVTIHVSGAANTMIGGTFGNMNLSSSGAGNFSVSGKANEVYTKISGASELNFENFHCPDIEIRCSGMSEVKMSGTGEKFKIDASGSGEIKAENFTVARAEVHASGSVTATLNVSEKLIAEGSGSVKIRYRGDPEVEQKGSGSSSVTKIG